MEKIVVLSPDAEEDIETIDSSLVYIIGGLVDRTVTKNETWVQANHLNIKRLRLPFLKYIPEYTNPILNVNTVIEVLAHWMVSKDWSSALKECVPQRKQQSLGRKALRRMERIRNQTSTPPTIEWCSGRNGNPNFEKYGDDQLSGLDIFNEPTEENPTK